MKDGPIPAGNEASSSRGGPQVGGPGSTQQRGSPSPLLPHGGSGMATLGGTPKAAGGRPWQQSRVPWPGTQAGSGRTEARGAGRPADTARRPPQHPRGGAGSIIRETRPQSPLRPRRQHLGVPGLPQTRCPDADRRRPGRGGEGLPTRETFRGPRTSGGSSRGSGEGTAPTQVREGSAEAHARLFSYSARGRGGCRSVGPRPVPNRLGSEGGWLGQAERRDQSRPGQGPPWPVSASRPSSRGRPPPASLPSPT